MTPTVVGRYVVLDEIASGGFASVHLGRLIGPAGFSRMVAVKRLHDALANEPEFVAMFLDEAWLAARIRHPNVCSTLDVLEENGQLLLVLDYVDGESLARLLGECARRALPVPIDVAVAITAGVLQGLHAAHETIDKGSPMGIVHRDVSPQNVLVGPDGVPRVVDFGIAKAIGRIHTTADGAIRGKAGYMASEQLLGESIDRRADVYATSVMLWEMLCNRPLFAGETVAATVLMVMEANVPPPSSINPLVSRALDAIVLRGLARLPGERYASALEMASELESAVRPATAREVGEWVTEVAGDALRQRAELLARAEVASAKLMPELMERRASTAMKIATRGTPQTPAAPPAPAPPPTRASPGSPAAPTLLSVGSEPAPREKTMVMPPSAPRPAAVPAPQRSRSPAVVFAIVAGLLVFAGGIVLAMGRVSHPQPTPATAPTEARSAPELPVASSVVAGPIASAPEPHVEPSTSTSTTRKHPGVRTPPTANKPSCNPPYRVDPSGVRIAKPECL